MGSQIPIPIKSHCLPLPTNENTNPQEETTVLKELVLRYEQRLKQIFKIINPYTTPIIEHRRISDKVKELKITIINS